MPEAGYPFSAIVGQESLRKALVLCAVHPAIGGVLVRGEKGTAKSTAVRALAALLPPVPQVPSDSAASADGAAERPARVVELPIGATEDRVVGSLDLERVLREGERAFQPGLLAAAHEGVLYVDEVNLLHDHLVDVLLDAAAMGRVHIERDGVSYSHPSRFTLVGTMNPEEGELRPQLLDRFGLAVDVVASRDVDVRVEVVRRRMAYEHDPDAFAARYADADRELAQRIRDARARVSDIRLPDTELRRISAVCAAFDVDGMRADLVVARTAVAHAAWRGGEEVTEEDVRVAAEMALPHRRRRDPFDEPGIDEEDLQRAFDEAAEQAEQPQSPESDEGDSDGPDDPNPDDPGPDDSGPGGGERADSSEPAAPQDDSNRDRADQPESDPPGDGPAKRPAPPRPAAAPGPTFRTNLLQVPGVGEGVPGRRSRSRSRQGRTVRATTEPGHGLNLIATLFAAAEHQFERGRQGTGPLRLAAADVRGSVREGREGNLVVFVVDASGSMAARDRLSAVTGAVVSLLRDAYQRRDKVAVVTVRGTSAQITLPPTSSVDIAARRLSAMTTGGRSPLAEGFVRAREIVLRERVRDPRRRALVVTLTDGRATGAKDALARARQAAARLAATGAASVVVDCETGLVRLGLAAELARSLRGGHVELAELSAEGVAGVVRAAA